MQRDIIQIDEEKCNGCGLCVTGCHEGALALVNGKARLVAETYCDGLGACLPACPTGAITIVKKDAAAFTAPAPGSKAAREEKTTTAPAAPIAQAANAQPPVPPLACGCPGTQSRSFNRADKPAAPAPVPAEAACCHGSETASAVESELQQWPVQIKLVPVRAPYLDHARLLIAADCTAYARANFHQEFIKGRITLIGCPKLDAGSYADKLTEIFRQNAIKSIMVVRMEVPCCGGIEHAVQQALLASGKMIPWQVVTISTDGRILED